MKLLRYGAPGHEKPGILDRNGATRDLSGVIDDIAGSTLLPESPLAWGASASSSASD